jgi:hypothetical protein
MTGFGLASIKQEGAPLHPYDVLDWDLSDEEYLIWEKKQYLAWKAWEDAQGREISDWHRMTVHEEPNKKTLQDEKPQ